MIHQANFTIRTFHTDGFGHVNNARYLELLEEARWQFAEQIDLIRMLQEANLGFIIMEIRLQFRAPVMEGDSIDVATSLISLGTASGEVRQTVRRSEENRVATRCLSHFILIDRDSGNSVPIDGAIRERLLDIIEPDANPIELQSAKEGINR